MNMGCTTVLRANSAIAAQVGAERARSWGVTGRACDGAGSRRAALPQGKASDPALPSPLAVVEMASMTPRWPTRPRRFWWRTRPRRLARRGTTLVRVACTGAIGVPTFGDTGDSLVVGLRLHDTQRPSEIIAGNRPAGHDIDVHHVLVRRSAVGGCLGCFVRAGAQGNAVPRELQVGDVVELGRHTGASSVGLAVVA